MDDVISMTKKPLIAYTITMRTWLKNNDYRLLIKHPQHLDWFNQATLLPLITLYLARVLAAPTLTGSNGTSRHGLPNHFDRLWV